MGHSPSERNGQAPQSGSLASSGASSPRRQISASSLVVTRGMNRGAATALLSRAVRWTRDAGFERLAVDFESANVTGSRFWLARFRPVCLSLLRRLDERALH